MGKNKECRTCYGSGWIDGGHGTESCPDCEGREPDWDSMREARDEMRAMAEADDSRSKR